MTAFLKLSVGQPSPLCHVNPPLSGGGSLIFDLQALMLAVYVSWPTQVDLDILSYGSVDIAFMNEGTSGVMVYRFANSHGGEIFVETPFHAGLEESAHIPHFDVGLLNPEDSCIMSMILQDDKQVIRVIRPLVLPFAICQAAHKLVVQQIAEARRKNFKVAHRKQLRRYQRRYASPEAACWTAGLRCQIGKEQKIWPT